MIAMPVFPAVDAQPLADVLLPYLKRIIMNQQELATALEAVRTSLGEVSTQLDKGISEVVVAISNAGTTSPEVDAAVTSLQQIAAALKSATQTLDDLNPDAPVV